MKIYAVMRIDSNHTSIFYCSIRKSNYTDNGLLKIKANKTSCFLFLKEKS